MLPALRKPAARPRTRNSRPDCLCAVAPQPYFPPGSAARRRPPPPGRDDRLREPIRVIKRRALAVARVLLRIRSDQPVEIARLELMGVARERGDVAHAVIAGPALKKVAEGQ